MHAPHAEEQVVAGLVTCSIGVTMEQRSNVLATPADRYWPLFRGHGIVEVTVGAKPKGQPP